MKKVKLTIDLLEHIFPLATDRKRIQFLAPLQRTLTEYQIDTPLRASAFLAQIAHESGELRYVKEIASGVAYNDRSDLGNTKAEAKEIARNKDIPVGSLYKGRGLLQITGYDNYVSCGKALGIDCVYFPELLEEPLYASLSAGWFWNSRNLSTLADQNKFKRITKRINGGYNGLEARVAYYTQIKEVFLDEARPYLA